MSSRPFFRRGRGYQGNHFRPYGGFHRAPFRHYQQQEEPAPVEPEKPAPLPLDPCLSFAEDFKARSAKRRAVISKALGIRHPDLLHFCLHTPQEIVKLRARSYRYQSSMAARRRAKLAKQKAKEIKKKASAAKASEKPVTGAAISTPLQETAQTTEAADQPLERASTPLLEGASGDTKPVVADAVPKAEPEGGDAAGQEDLDDANNQQSTTQSLSGGPQNDYSFHFICTGERPANFVRDVGLANRFEEYPKLRDLIRSKDFLIQSTNTPPFCLKADLSTFNLTDLGTEFDCVLIEPPLEDYQYQGQVFDKYWNWDEIEALNIGAITAARSFIWLWVGAGEGLDRGRRCLSKWGFRRCEDIVWVKTNTNHVGPSSVIEPKSLFQRTKEHCLMGIKGTVLRSKDGDFIHANIDLDVIIEEEPEAGVKDKPIEIFHIIEHFCLGRRRLHLFSRESTVRPGWVCVGNELIRSNYDAETYRQSIESGPGLTTGCTEEIERMRPKTPPLLKAAVAAQAAQAASAATGQSVVMSGSSVVQPSPLAPSVIASSLMLQQQHSESPGLGL